MDPENIELIEKTLSQLNIRSRKYPIKNGIIYFCNADGYITFNLVINNDRTIKIWRYVQTSLFACRLSEVDNILTFAPLLTHSIANGFPITFPLPITAMFLSLISPR